MENMISIIVPVYNVEKYLPYCIESLLSQTFRTIEVILVDDGSTDNSGNICDEYKLKDDRIVVIHKINSGVVAARIEGLKIAQGKYITFVDGDDYVDKNMCAVLYDNMELFELDSCLFNEAIIAKEKILYTGNKYNIDNLSEYEYIYDFTSKNTLVIGSVCGGIYRKNILLGTYKFIDNRLYFGEDLLWQYAALFTSKKIKVIDDILYFYRKHGEQITSKYKRNFLSNFILFCNCLDKITISLANKSIKKQIDYRKMREIKNLIVNECLSDIKNVDKLKNIEKIADCEVIKNILSKIEYCNLSSSDKLFVYLLRKRLSMILCVVTIIKFKILKKLKNMV